uniref:Uncharacterized protein n=1 Tax=Bombyx mori TaxID=7091 RepID=A0A8R2MAU1_BOMMO
YEAAYEYNFNKNKVFHLKAFGVGEACWNSGWHQTPLGRMIRQDIIIVLLRAQQPVTIKFPGLQSIQLETFSSIMTTSYSYFNIETV